MVVFNKTIIPLAIVGYEIILANLNWLFASCWLSTILQPTHAHGNILLYYIDRSVLLENTLRVKFIRNYIRDPSGVFSISSLVRILMTSFPALSQSFVQTVGEKWRAIDLSI